MCAELASYAGLPFLILCGGAAVAMIIAAMGFSDYLARK